MRTVTYKELMALGFPEHKSRNIIRNAKKFAPLSLQAKGSRRIEQL
ncbi:DUF3173 family protein [Bacillus sp. A015]